MKYKIFVQSGDITQSRKNGMNGLVYSFGASEKGSLFKVKEDNPYERWSIPKRHGTTFRLELIMEGQPTFQVDDILF